MEAQLRISNKIDGVPNELISASYMLQIFQAENYARTIKAWYNQCPPPLKQRLMSVLISPDIPLTVLIYGTLVLFSSPVVAIMAQEITQ